MAQIVHPGKIESELERIWDSFQGTNKMRACLFNLIIYAKKSQRIDYLTQIAQKVIEKFPSRIIFITFDDKASNQELKTAVSVMTADEGENEIACDLIEIEVCKTHHPRVPFVILPHLLPDLPVYLVHGDDPSLDNPISLKLEHFARRIIFDSESTTNLSAFAQAVLAHKEKSKADVADLNWARIEGWRQLFAGIFKSQDDLDLLRHATNLHFHYNAEESDFLCHTNIQSIYLQGWLACQLEWKLKKINKEGDTLSFSYESAHSSPRVFLHPAKMANVPAGRILSIEIETDREYRYSFKRNLKCPHHVMIEKSSPEFCSLPTHYVLDKDVSGQSLVKEICHKGTSQHYLKLLSLLSKIKSECLR